MPTIIDWKVTNVEDDFHFSSKVVRRGNGDNLSIGLKVFDHKTEKDVPLFFRGEKMFLPFGINGNSKDIEQKFRNRAGMTFPTVRKDQTTGEWVGDDNILPFFKFLEKIDNFVKKTVCDNYSTWFNKTYSKDTLEAFHSSFLSMNSEGVITGKFSPMLNTKIEYYEDKDKQGNVVLDDKGNVTGKYVSRLYDDKKNILKWDTEGKFRGLYCIPVLKATGLWFANKSYGCCLKIVQLMVFPKDEFDGCIIDLSENEIQSYTVEHPKLVPSEQDDDKNEEEDLSVCIIDGTSEDGKSSSSSKDFVPPPTAKRQKIEAN